MPTERKRAIRTTAAWTANQAAMEAEYGVGNYYTTLSAWESGEQTDLVTANEIRTAVCYNDWPSGLSDSVQINGWTTDATRYPKITVAEGHRHDGIPGGTGGFRVRQATSGSSLFLIWNGFTRIEWVDVVQLATGDTKYCFRIFGASNCSFFACLAKNSTSSTNLAAFETNQTYKATLCFAYGSKIGFSGNIASAADNCVAYGCVVGFGGIGGTGVARNCVAYNNTENYATGWAFSNFGENNASSGADAPGANPVNNITSAAFADAANNDFHLSSGSVLRGAGVNLYSDFQTDIDGDTWPSVGAWDIGFDYFVAAGGAPTLSLSGVIDITATSARPQVTLAY